MYTKNKPKQNIGHKAFDASYGACMYITLRQCSNNIYDVMMCFVSHNLDERVDASKCICL